jgi:3-oxoacyl-[acyl-carrier-protein] synthase III
VKPILSRAKKHNNYKTFFGRKHFMGNTFFSFSNAGILSVQHVDAPIVKTSAEFDSELSETYERLGLQPGMLENVAGIRERRWWDVDAEGKPATSFADAASLAGHKVLESADIDPQKIGLLIDSSVCRSHLEPSAAVDVHQQLGLASSCINFDLSNACLGFVNSMHLAGTMIDAGQIDYALIVDGEGAREPQENTIKKLQSPETTVMDIFNNFATLTLGSGGVAMLLGRMDQNPEAHRLIGGTSRAATQHNKLCVGDLNSMQTDTKALLEAGTQLSVETWEEAKS